MSPPEPSALALFWAAVIAVSVAVYVILDGFDLGVGVLFGATRDEERRTEMMDAIAPYWDGNETWLVAIGASLFAAFPVVYAVFMAAFYIPVLLLLVGLIFRGIAFEFRHRSTRLRGLWNTGFWLGSAVVGFVQGAALGALTSGIQLADGHFAGGHFDWLAPLPLVTGFGLVLGYALLGGGWLVLKCEGELRHWAYARIPWLALAVFVALVAAVALTLDQSAIARGHWAERRFGAAFPALGVAALLAVLWGARRRHDRVPFAAAVLFFLAAYATLGVAFWPYMIPYEVTVASAAAPDASLAFLFWGAGLFVLPVIAVYTLGVYWIFRGKLCHTR